MGAWFFYILEYENEKEMKIEEALDLNRLRKKAIFRILSVFQNRQRGGRAEGTMGLLLWYESELQRVKLPEALEWDMWGYGNIVPRTVAGRALSVVYAIIGIPLVLAILAKFGRFLEKTVTRCWLRHQEKMKKARKRTSKRVKAALQHDPHHASNAVIIKMEEAQFYQPIKQKLPQTQTTVESRQVKNSKSKNDFI
ncbi:Ion channel [Dictyocaulus viviparus]|uniref:Ion channel n=1 Tax=Dictyocaulus viviparus TaxID=29172 RepID=A0A0D8XB39_DICVI|nr:Ion channel [Dictyocaulus viviparus]